MNLLLTFVLLISFNNVKNISNSPAHGSSSHLTVEANKPTMCGAFSFVMSAQHKKLNMQTFGRLLVTTEAYTKKEKDYVAHYYHCLCLCGGSIIVKSHHLTNRHTQSCGCLFRATRFKHGYSSKDKEYNAWLHMKKRCDPNTTNLEHFTNYYLRGIRVCDRWLDSFENFLADMGHSPSSKHSLDRKNNDGNYAPDNCRWATAKEQANNRRPRKH